MSPNSMPTVPIEEKYKPSFDLPESVGNGIGDKKIGQKIKAIVNFIVIEKTKSYTIFKVNGFYLIQSARRY